MGNSTDFFENHYFGIGGEHFVMADFIIRGYEAVKISPDFGYDIHVTNKNQTFNQAKSVAELSLYLQVKTRLINPTVENKVIKFYVEKDNFSKILTDKIGILVLIMIVGQKAWDSFKADSALQTFDGNQIFNRQYQLDRSEYNYFEQFRNIWLGNKDLIILNEKNFFADYTSSEGKEYKVISYDIDGNYFLDNNNEPSSTIGESKLHLFCITDNIFGYEHSKLFL